VEKKANKIFTILVGNGIDEGQAFVVAGRAGSLKEARTLCLEPKFILQHICSRKEGAYVLIVSATGHQIFLPIQAILDSQKP
jgi:hypothetical protein